MSGVIRVETRTEVEIECHRLTHEFRGQPVLDAIDLRVSAGTCCAVVGGNATGKTTLLKCLAGFLKPTQGSVSWNRWDDGICRPIEKLELRGMIGIVSHTTYACPYFTVRENITFAARMHRLENVPSQVARAISHAQLEEYTDRPAGRLSRGLAQRLAIAIALVHNPRLIILDEPDTGLDQTGLDWLFDTLCNLVSSQRTVVVATHRREWIARLQPRFLEMDLGGIRELCATRGTAELCNTAAA